MKLPTPAWLLLALALAPRAAAQDPQQVLADFKQAAKLAVKTCKDDLADLAAELQEDIQILEIGVDDLAGGDDGPIDDFAAALIAYQQAAYLVVSQGSDDVGTAAGVAIAALTAGGADESVHPVGLVLGDGGALDDALVQIQKAALKTNAGVVKKLAKLAKKLRAKTDMRLALVLPAQPLRRIAPKSGGFAGSPPSSLFIDVLVSFNRGGEDDEGRMWVSGYGGSGEGDVDVHLNGGSSLTDTVTPAVFDGRWSFASDVATDPLKEGNYFVFVQQGGGAYASNAIGMP